MFGLWGIGFFSPELISTALKGAPQSQVDTVRAWGLTFQDSGAIVGMLTFTYFASRWQRRGAFLCSFILSMVVTAYVFYSLKSPKDAYWMLPMMGFAFGGLFAGYSIYFPELFPTRVRGTGQGFSYNTGRAIGSFVPTVVGVAAPSFGLGEAMGICSASAYVLVLLAVALLPETRGRELEATVVSDASIRRDLIGIDPQLQHR